VQLMNLLRQFSRLVAIITDWLLIGSGLLLVFISLVRVDVVLARYFLLCCGLLFSGFGFWFRHQRLRKQN
jgi:uncharacterized membrane protein YobD (UPF0266 family)